MESIRIIWAGEREAHVIVPNGRSVACYKTLIASGAEGIAEITPGFQTVQIRLRDGADPEQTMTLVRSVVKDWNGETPDESVRMIEIPICSDPEFAPDLDEIARNAGLSAIAAAELYASGAYTVRFLGFSPGFPYFNGLPESLHTPRLETPRARVRAGSVGIAGAHTGIYPQATPGGWRLIGATPMPLFDPSRDPPALLEPGDRVCFRRITRSEFDALERGRA